MKVLTIKQPYAELIKEKTKRFEIRSKKTNYRGELYIHSSRTKIKNDMLKRHLKNRELEYGYILFKCNLIDCIFIDEDFLKIMRKDAPKNLYGNDCIGYYAWVIDDVKPLKETIPAKGNLGIWNYYNELEIMSKIE